MLSVTSRKFIT